MIDHRVHVYILRGHGESVLNHANQLVLLICACMMCQMYISGCSVALPVLPRATNWVR